MMRRDARRTSSDQERSEPRLQQITEVGGEGGNL